MPVLADLLALPLRLDDHDSALYQAGFSGACAVSGSAVFARISMSG